MIWIIAGSYNNGIGNDYHLRQTNATADLVYFLTYRLGAITALTDGGQNVVETLTYDSFGNNAGSTRTRYTYTGRERDPDTGLLYYRARFYDPQLGRFASEDPLGFLARDINLYRYVQGNPVRFVDPTGLRRCNPIVGAIIGGIVGGVGGAASGAVLGAVAGGTIGGVGLSFIVPGIGTLAGLGGGAAVGAQAGAFAGSGIGVGLGIGIGIDYCNGDDPCDNPPKTLPFPKVEPIPVPPPRDLDDCIKRLVDCLRFAGTDPRRSEECRKAFEACKEMLR